MRMYGLHRCGNDQPSVGGVFDGDGSYANIEQENANEDPTIDNLVNYPNCPLSKEDVQEDQDGICCDTCLVWLHKTCLHFTDEEFEDRVHSSNPWFCSHCLSLKSNKITWGEYEGEEAIKKVIQSTYDNILGWKKNILTLPRGKSGTAFLKELTRLLNLFVHKTKWERLAISLVHIFIPIMLQKPSLKSKPKDNAKYLLWRLERWKNGNLKSLLDEINEIQKRLKKTFTRKQESNEKAFIRLMTFGKVGQAAKFINNEAFITDVTQLNDEIKNILVEKHPNARGVDAQILIPQSATQFQPVIFEEITAETVQKKQEI